MQQQSPCEEVDGRHAGERCLISMWNLHGMLFLHQPHFRYCNHGNKDYLSVKGVLILTRVITVFVVTMVIKAGKPLSVQSKIFIVITLTTKAHGRPAVLK